MRRSDLKLCLITDEVSPSLDEGLAFARAEGIDTVDLRVIDGRNVLALSRTELDEAARRVRAAGLSVSCICTPLLKWSPPGKASQAKGDQSAYRHPRLRALPDIANAYRRGLPPSAADLARLLPFSDILHFKDYSNAARRFVAIGEGDIPFTTLLAATLPAHAAPMMLTIETHAPSEPAATTRRSVHGLRRMVDGFGLA